MDKLEWAQKLNTEWGMQINWTNLKKSELEKIYTKFKNVIPVDGLTADALVEKVKDPYALGINLLQIYIANQARAKVEEVGDFLITENIGQGAIVEQIIDQIVNKLGRSGGLLEKFLKSRSSK